MIPLYIKNYLSLIRHGSKVNSYKLVWAKAIVEISEEEPTINNTISLENIALKVFKYYWNQTIYFDLIQGNNPNKRPEFVSEVRKEIELFYQKQENRQPVHFEKIEHDLDLNVRKLVSILKKDVSWRFPLINKDSLPIYHYTRGENEIRNLDSKLLSDYADILYEAINFKWTLILENFNNVPRIAKKVRIQDFGNIKRKSLGSFSQFIIEENKDKVCFICDNIIEDKPSIDHVIPWTFIFSDDLWNLVFVHKSCNSSKSNTIPSENMINRLEQRNKKILEVLSDHRVLSTKKHFRELELAVQRDYVRKFWIQCKS